MVGSNPLGRNLEGREKGQQRELGVIPGRETRGFGFLKPNQGFQNWGPLRKGFKGGY